MSRKLLYIINPIAGKGKNLARKSFIEAYTKNAGIEFIFANSASDGDYSTHITLIEEQAITDVIICGGDGTVSQALAGLYKCKVNFGIFPIGSGNGLARAANIPMNAKKALDLIFKGNAFTTDALEVNGKFACMLIGLGFDAAVATEFAKSKSRGLKTYVKEILKQFFGAPFYSFTITVNNKRFQTKSFLISIANGNQYGNNFKIAPFASLTDGLADIVIVNRQSKWGLLQRIAGQITGHSKFVDAENINPASPLLHFRSASITIENNNSAPFHIDGDPVSTPSKVDVKVIPNAYLLLRTK